MTRRTERQRLRSLPTDLAAKVAAGICGLHAAEVMAAGRSNTARQERERADRIRAWQERQAEETRMAKPWAEFVWAHSRALAEFVIHRDFPIREAVRLVKESTGCDVGCGHKPLTAQQWAEFLRVLAAAPGDE